MMEQYDLREEFEEEIAPRLHDILAVCQKKGISITVCASVVRDGDREITANMVVKRHNNLSPLLELLARLMADPSTVPLIMNYYLLFKVMVDHGFHPGAEYSTLEMDAHGLGLKETGPGVEPESSGEESGSTEVIPEVYKDYLNGLDLDLGD